MVPSSSSARPAAAGSSWGASKTSGISDNVFMQNELLRAAIKSGMLGIVLAWALWENSRIVDRAFLVIERNTAILGRLEKVLNE